MNQKGFSLSIILVVVGLLLSASVSYYYFSNPKDDLVQSEVSVQDKINSAVVNRMMELGSNQGFDSNYTFKITHTSPRYTRGEVIVDGIIQNVYLVAISDEWKVVEISEEPISCEKAQRMGFPSNMISDCLYKHPKAEEVPNILLKIKEGLIDVDELQIIGQINIINEPNAQIIEIMSDDGESISISYNNDNDLSNFSNGDYVVVDVTVSENDDGEITLNLEDIDEIETIANLINEPNTTQDDMSNDPSIDISVGDTPAGDTQSDTNNTGDTNNTDDSNSLIDLDPEPEVYDVTNLSSSDPNLAEFFNSLIDRDNSGLNVHIISDF